MTGGLLADACALIVFHGEAGVGMSKRGLAAMAGPEIGVSAITVWEITRKAGLGKLPALPEAGAGGFSAFLRANGYRLLALAPEIAERANTLPPHHADPMDRILIATALAENMTVVTNDRWFTTYGVRVLW